MVDGVRKLCLAVMVMLVLTLVSCGSKEQREDTKGDVTVVDLEPGESALYSHEDIYDAMDEVLESFEEEFPGCVLTNLVYDEEYSVQKAAQWAERYGDDEAIIFLSGIDAIKDSADGKLKSGVSYKDWQWILTRDDGGSWEVQVWGYELSP